MIQRMRNDIMKKITFPNGGYYEGEFVDGKRHGNGIYKSS